MLKVTYKIERLEKHHHRESFCCGVEQLDHYLHCQAGQDIRKHVAATYVLTKEKQLTVLGYYSLASFSIDCSEVPESFRKKLPKYSRLPVTLLGRLAVDQNYQGNGLGEYLLANALKRSWRTSHEIASLAVVVEAINDEAISFYQLYGFAMLKEQKKLYISMDTIAKAYN